MLQNTCDLTVRAVKPVRTLRYDWVSPPPRFIPSIEDPSIEGINMSSVISLMNRGFAYFMRWAIHGTKKRRKL